MPCPANSLCAQNAEKHGGGIREIGDHSREISKRRRITGGRGPVEPSGWTAPCPPPPQKGSLAGSPKNQPGNFRGLQKRTFARHAPAPLPRPSTPRIIYPASPKPCAHLPKHIYCECQTMKCYTVEVSVLQHAQLHSHTCGMPPLSPAGEELSPADQGDQAD